jgi:glucose-6-phosphate dehydrogenase assembly protein OpcA
MSVVAEVEHELLRLRTRESDGSLTGQRTSTMTHVVWAPPRWLERAREVLAGLEERHPARTIFLIPERGRSNEVKAEVHLRETAVEGLPSEVFAEVIELRLRGGSAEHPASLLLPLLVSDLPAFCRWRGEPAWRSSALAEIVGVCDRLVVNSSEWSRPSRGYARLVSLFDRIAVSDIAFSRTLPWRARIAELWPSISGVGRLRVEGPQADAVLLAGWLRSRLRRDVSLTRRGAAELRGVWLDGERVEGVAAPPRSPSDMLSDELDVTGRDKVYEAAVRAAADTSELDDAWL